MHPCPAGYAQHAPHQGSLAPHWHRPADSLPTRVQVVIRVRPPLPRELQGMRPFENTVMADPSHRTIILSENLQSLQSGGATNTENGLASISDLGACSTISPCLSGVPSACPHWLGKHAGYAPQVLSARMHSSHCAAHTGAVLLSSRAYTLQVFSTYRFTFDHVYTAEALQAEVYQQTARGAVHNALQVCLAAVLAERRLEGMC